MLDDQQYSHVNPMANAVRALSMDAVEKAKSGHPGMPMGFADVATVLFTEFAKFDSSAPDWADRDRVILSAGHGSMLLYSALYLLGYPGWGIDDLRNFRQLGSPAAGHPELGHGTGIETTTGPLGQGLATAVGMALGEAMDSERFGSGIVDHQTWVIAGDGCLMEGISQEAITMAGHLKLNKLTVLFDDNAITIDGGTALTTEEDQLRRFGAAGWNTLSADGHSDVDIRQALEAAQSADRPTIIAFKTRIGFGAGEKEGTAKCHGSPLGADGLAAARANLNWQHAPFEVPEDILNQWRDAGERSTGTHETWKARVEALSVEEQAAFTDHMSGASLTKAASLAEDVIAEFASSGAPLATRVASGKVLETLAAEIPSLIGGSADLTGPVNTRTSDMQAITSDNYAGRYIHYGVREHGMAAIMNGLALHGGYVPYSGTFLVFQGYMLGAMRLSALMRTRVIYVLTHDSIGLGEDGPTHQPVESLAQLRALPGMTVYRPGDPIEVAEAWASALALDGPSVIVLSRQSVPVLRAGTLPQSGAGAGGYVLREAKGGRRDVTLVGTGSELSLAVEAADTLAAEGINAAVVSLPSFERFAEQTEDYQTAVLGGSDIPIVAVEAALRFGWDGIVGQKGGFVGMTGFGASAPAGELYKHFGITKEAVAQAARVQISGKADQ